MRIFSLFFLMLVFAFPVAAQMTPQALEKMLSESLPGSVSADNTVTVTQKGPDWVIAYPSFRVPQEDGSHWRVGSATVTLLQPTGTGVADARIVMPTKSELVSTAGRVQSVITLTGQDLKGKWSFDRNSLTEMNGTVRTAQWR